ncbi:unnamed protein product [Cladocopium goreaui]|uniref:LINE-1 reverse transcriptase-like n=1 Tax=Cladocopium goreaui TaxID=2562237 RepID=A0A9P1G661_9DINO|nr:unnamed protein product [Cladocopium goreaui]
MDKSLSYCSLGDPCALVVQVLGHVVDDWYECKGISPAQSFRLRSPIDLQAGIHTFYDLVLLSKDPMSLGFGVDTQRVKDFHLGANFMQVNTINFKSTSRGALDLPMILYPFRARQLMELDLPLGLRQDWARRFFNSNGKIYVIYEFHRHWTLLAGQLMDKMEWCHFDGLSTEGSQVQLQCAKHVATRLSHCLGLRMGGLTSSSGQQQSHAHTCGTIALHNMAVSLRLGSVLPLLAEHELHQWFFQLCSAQPSVIAKGKTNEQDPLTRMLMDKGVPSQAVADRAKMVRHQLGHQQVQQALQAKNPWAALKAAASKPGKMFRLITEEELQQHVHHRAQTKHGAKIQNAKTKKNAAQRSGPVQLDPDDFKLDAQHFQDDDGNQVPQLHFQDIAQLEPIIFPALCISTDEHTIIMGYILQLGDKTIKRKMAGNESEPDTVETQVIKLQVFKDQLEMAWDRFATAPVRHLIQMMEAMQLCKGQRCGIDCCKHHPGVDETLDAVIMEVWSRNFVDDNGKKTDPSSADTFTVFLRIPESALMKILTTSPLGVYVEPRGKQPREHDDKFKVIWLPGSSFTEAQHQCRTYSKSLCLVRLKLKYGIRVKQCDEAAAWAKLRPGVEFVDMSIQQIYEIFPLPHGTQRAAINKILADWSWKARALQPGRGNFHHMAWRIGSAETPPANVLTAFGADVIIKEIKNLQIPETKPTIYAPAKTQKHLRETPAPSSARSSGNSDPWLEKDPWGGYAKTTTTPSAGRHYKAEFQDQIRETVGTALKEQHHKDILMTAPANDYSTETEQRFVAIESGLHELKAQNGQFLQWFQQTGERLQQNESMMQDVQDNVQQHASALQLMSASLTNYEHTIGEVQQTLNLHQQEIHAMGTNFSATMRTMKDDLSGELMQSFDQQFNKLEALLEKRHKTS